VVTFATAALVLTWLSWRWVFRLPVLLLFAGAAVVWLLARDHPAELGLSSPVSGDELDARSRRVEAAADARASLPARLRSAFATGPFLFASLGFGFANWARLGLLVWVPSHLMGAGATTGHGVAWIPLALPVGMAIGALVEGEAVDRFLGGNHPRLIVLSLLLAAVATLGLLAVPLDGRGVGLLFVAGFLVFGPVPSFTVLVAE